MQSVFSFHTRQRAILDIGLPVCSLFWILVKYCSIGESDFFNDSPSVDLGRLNSSSNCWNVFDSCSLISWWTKFRFRWLHFLYPPSSFNDINPFKWAILDRADTLLGRPKVLCTSLHAAIVAFDHLPRVSSRALFSVNGTSDKGIRAQSDFSISSHLVSLSSKIQTVRALSRQVNQ